MKRKLLTLLAVALSVLALRCGTAAAADFEASGTVYTSSIPAGKTLILKGDTTLVVNEDKVLESIRGESYALTVQGKGVLTIQANDSGIRVKNFGSTLEGTIMVKTNTDGSTSDMNSDYGLYAAGAISTSGTDIQIYPELAHGIYAGNGDIVMSGSFMVGTSSDGMKDVTACRGKIDLSGSYFVPFICAREGNIFLQGDCHASQIFAAAGDVTMMGRIVVHSTGIGEHTDDPDALPCIYAGNDISMISGTLNVRGQTGVVAVRNINLSGSNEIRNKDGYDDELNDPTAIGPAIYSKRGNVTLSGTNVVYGNCPIEARNGIVYLHGRLEVGSIDSLYKRLAVIGNGGIYSDCSVIRTNTVNFGYGLNNYYFLVQFWPTDGSGSMPPKICWNGAQITLPANLFDAPDNYEFSGWFDESSMYYQPGDHAVIYRSTDFYADWQRIPHTVTFAPGSGSGTMDSLTVGQGEQLTLPACTFTPPSLPGTTYSFDRWKIGTSLYNPGSKVTIMEDTTVTATWKSGTVLVEFLPNGGTGKMASPFLSKGDTYTLPENGFKPPAGKAFLYWNVSSSVNYLSPGATITVLSDITVKPMWRNAVISFDPNGGTGTMAPVTMSDSMNGIYTFPACSFTPPANKTFNGWQIGNILRMPGETRPIYGDLVVKALWADRMYTVSFNPGGGTGTMSPVEVTSGSVYTFPASTFTPPSGKVFRGWRLSGKVYHQGETVTVTGDMQLYAEWQENPDNVYTLTFDGNGLTGYMAPISVQSGETITLPECTFEMSESMYFQKWNLGAHFGFYKKPGDTITLDQNAAATAIWGYKPQCTVTFLTNGLYKGELPASQTGYSGFCATEPEPLQMDGRIFLGWFTNLTTNEEFRWDFSTPVTDNLKLYCGWGSAPPVAHPISITADGHGTAAAYDAYEDGNEIWEATKNTWVYVTVTPDPGYEQYHYLRWTTASGQSGYSSLNRFTMPDEAIAVTVTFRPVRVSFILPASLTVIEDGAFSGISAEAVVIPGSVTEIIGDPFAGSSVATIYGYPGSAAETFTVHYPQYAFIPIDDEWMDGQ